MNELGELFFRRQFLFSKNSVTKPFPEKWVQVKVRDYFFYIHPDCEYTRYDSDKGAYIILGYILDPFNVNHDNQEILKSIDKKFDPAIGNLNALCSSTNLFGGRWALFFFGNENEIAFNDATGLKQLFFSYDKNNLLLSSSEELLAYVTGTTIDSGIKENYLDKYSDHTGIWWPNDTTPYRNIRCLLPDFYFDIKKKTLFRFWPVISPETRTNNDQLEYIYCMLRGMILSMSERTTLSLALTAGNDSRLFLCFLKEFVKYFTTYTVYIDDENFKKGDYIVPKQLSEYYGFSHSMIIERTNDLIFTEAYKSNSSLNRPVFLNMAYSLFKHWPEGHISVQAVVNEIGRTKYEYRPYKLNAGEIADMTYMGKNIFVLNAFEAWLDEVKVVTADNGLRIEDMFYLEQRMGRWNSMNRKEWDIAQDVFEPFNSREIIGSIMQLPKIFKIRNNNKLYQYLLSKFTCDFSAVPVLQSPQLKTYNKYVKYLKGYLSRIINR